MGGGFNPTNFSPVANNSTKNSSPSPAGSCSYCAVQTQPPHSVQDGGAGGLGGVPELTRAVRAHHGIHAAVRGSARGRRGKGHEDESVAFAAHLSLFGGAPC